MSEPKKQTILVIGQASSATGFSRVLHNILDHLKSKYDIHHFGINYHGPVIDCGWKIYPNQLDGDVSGAYQLEAFLANLRPQIVLILNDIWDLSIYMGILWQYRDRIKTIAYCPLNGELLNLNLLQNLVGFDRLVVYTEFARQNIRDGIHAVQAKFPEFSPPEIRIIPHGTDTKNFYPLDQGSAGAGFGNSRSLARRILFPDQAELWEAFIVLNANRNQPRKRIDITIQGFARFASNKPKHVKLYLHMGVAEFSRSVLEIATECNVADRILLTRHSDAHPSVPEDKLNLIYNACDVGINTASGEGWGLVSFEHAATGAAQVVPKHSACEELWQGFAELVEPDAELINCGMNLKQKRVAVEGVATALERLYQDPEYLEKMSRLAFLNATSHAYNWEAISRQWDELFREIIPSCV